jgi:tetratricopeptide (TPR) repeat protein
MRALSTILVILMFAAEPTNSEIQVYAGRKAAAVPFVNKGSDLMQRGEGAAARRNFDEAIRIDPTMWPAYYARAFLLMKQGNWQLALQDLNAGIRLKPDFYRMSIMRAIVNQQLGRYGASLAELDRVLSLHPNTNEHSLALSVRAWLEVMCPDPSFRNTKKAIADAKRACELSRWNNVGCLYALAAAYAEAGDFDAAIRYEEQALKGRLKDPLVILGDWPDGARRRLALYKHRRSVRKPSEGR